MKPTPVHGLSPRLPHLDPVVFGTVCGLVAAVGYTAANIGLREVSGRCDPIWVSCIREVPNVLLVGPWLIFRALRGQRVLPPGKVLLLLILAAVFSHLAGNVVLVWCMSVIGMAMTVPIVLGMMIVAGAVLGRLVLGETVTRQMLLAMALLVVAVFVTSLGAGQAHESVAGAAGQVAAPAGAWLLVRAVGGACLAGVAYSVLGVAIRYGADRSPQSATIVVVGTVGVVMLGLVTQARFGTDIVRTTAPGDLKVMFLAGVVNTIAFLALTKALQLTSVVFVNALNASQAAMAAIAGIAITRFHEPPSVALVVGVVLTVAGLLMMKGRNGKAIPAVEP